MADASRIEALDGTRWKGHGELWLDPSGDDALTYECSLSVDGTTVRYTWTYEGKEQRGTVSLGADGPTWVDSWHHPEPVACTPQPEPWGVFDLFCTYSAGGGPDWGWRTLLAERPTGELVLQMTNIAPWGEEGRAVRMVLTRQS